MADKIRVGIVGATVTQGGSGWGANAHVPAIAILPDYELKAVCTSRKETAQASKENFGADLAFTDINAMAAHPDVDLNHDQPRPAPDKLKHQISHHLAEIRK